ncbi:MAG: hypothetical protein M3R21_04985 [Candidatus Dormibacteraeota bacterium]|nr:hypothetical protein [Candidatus Dormibacteraeota bacterium]
MPKPSTVAHAPSEQLAPVGEVPPPDVVEFIRFCHDRRGLGWPELYDEMCSVASRREFRGWGHEELAVRGLTFSLFDMQRMAGWVRQVIGRSSAGPVTAAPRSVILPLPGSGA